VKRRELLAAGIGSAATLVGLGAGLLSPRRVLAEWPATAFQATKLEDAMTSLLGGNQPKPSEQVRIKAPEIAENGLSVPVTIEADVPVESIALFVAENQTPAIAHFRVGSKMALPLVFRVKMAKTTDVVVVVDSAGQALLARATVKVTVGGCG